MIEFIHPDSFRTIKQLEDLNLGNNVFPTLPTRGLTNLLHLKTFNNPELREFPPPATFPRLQTVVLSYAYHCCSFLMNNYNVVTTTKSPVEESVLIPDEKDLDMALWNSTITDFWPQFRKFWKFNKKTTNNFLFPSRTKLLKTYISLRPGWI